MAVYGCVGALVAAVVAVTVAVEITADLPPCRRLRAPTEWMITAVVVVAFGQMRRQKRLEADTIREWRRGRRLGDWHRLAYDVVAGVGDQHPTVGGHRHILRPAELGVGGRSVVSPAAQGAHGARHPGDHTSG
jgi:hypothetical protein